jgi:O-antigen/teichoic acid export membrane protein
VSTTVATPPETGRRRLAARGALINSAFQVGIGGLNMLKTVIAAGFLTAADFGIWGIVLLGVSFAGVMRTAAIGDKYIQQSEPDQVLAFRKAFTLELISAWGLFGVMCLLAPLLALVYGQPELIPATLVLALVLPASALLAPTWIFYRRMDYFRQRLILAIDPVISFAVTIFLAAGGVGYWSLVIGFVVGSLVAGAVAMAMSPIRPGLDYHAGTMREYLSFSWPLVVAAGGGIMIGQVSLLLGDWALGLGGAGAIALASSFAIYTDSVDRIITQTLYPAICRVADRTELLLETFTKSNRLTLLWGMPFGIALALFASDLVHFGIGDQWTSAITLIEVFGVAAAINHIGFNWDAYYRARGTTKPIPLVVGTGFVTLLAVGTPLLFTIGLDGYAIGVAAMTATTLVLRWYFVTRLFPGFRVFRYIARAVAPTIPAAAAVLILRQFESGARTADMALAELALFVLLAAGAALVTERELLREARGYLRRRSAGAGDSALATVVNDVPDGEALR